MRALYRGFFLTSGILFSGVSAVGAQESRKLILPVRDVLSDVIFSAKVDKIAVRYWDQDHKIQLYAFPSLRRLGDLGESICPHSTCFSPCGKYVAINANTDKDGAVSVWDIGVEPPRKVKLLTQKKANIDIEFGRIEQMRFSPDSKQIIAIDARSIHLWRWQESARSQVEWSLPGNRHWASRFLTPDTLLNIRGKPGMGVTEIFAADGKGLRKLRDVDARLSGPENFYVTPDGKHAVVVKWKEGRSTFVLDLDKPGSEIVDRMNDHWLPETEPKDGDDEGEKYYVPASAITPDLFVIIHYYEVFKKRAVVRQGIGFFPRTPAKKKEFGLDPQKHTHLFLPVPDRSLFPAKIVISPDGRWLTFTDINLPPRIWEVKTLGKALLAEKGVVKK